MSTISEKVYIPMLSIIQSALQQLSKGNPVLLLFWAGRGGGKTTFLEFLKRSLQANDIVLLGPWDCRSPLSGDLATQILTAIERVPRDARKLLLLDNIDELLRTNDGEPFFAFEHEVLRELVKRGDTLIIATGRSPLVQWRDYDVRIAAQDHHIPPLSREEVAEWARVQGLDPDRAFALSMGYPQVLAWLEEQPDLPLEEIDRRVVALFLDGLPEKAHQLAEVASLLPVFDLAALRPLLSSEEDGESFYGKYTEHVGELIRAGLVALDIEVGAYRFRESAVRRLLARGLRHRDPEWFRHIHQVAANYYREEATRAAYLHRVLVSALYHTAWVDSAEKCVQWVGETLGLWMSAPWEKVLKTWETGAGDEATREELRELLSPDAFERITRLLESAAQAAEQLLTQAQEVKR